MVEGLVIVEVKCIEKLAPRMTALPESWKEYFRERLEKARRPTSAEY